MRTIVLCGESRCINELSVDRVAEGGTATINDSIGLGSWSSAGAASVPAIADVPEGPSVEERRL